MYKIGSIVELESATYELKHPKTGEGLGVIFTLAGPSHAGSSVPAIGPRGASAEGIPARRARRSARRSKSRQSSASRMPSRRCWGGLVPTANTARPRPASGSRDPREGWVVRQLTEALAEQTRFIEDSALV
jgi:hypothetical protein